MNTKNNQLSRATDEKIIRAVFFFIEQEQRPLSRITVREVCERAGINRSTFYAHYMDVYDVVEKTEATMSRRLTEAFLEQLDQGAPMEAGYLSLFRFIQQYQQFYRLYLNETGKTGVIGVAWDLLSDHLSRISPKDFGFSSEKELTYQGAFYLYGLTAMIRLWLNGGCEESLEEMVGCLKNQYRSAQEKLGFWYL